MKKVLAAFFIAVLLVLPSFADDNAPKEKPLWDHGDNVSNISYRNYQIYKILDQLDAYVVLYEQHGVNIGQAVIPKKWFTEQPRKLEFRTKPVSLNPYMTVIWKDNQFVRVWLTVPVSHQDATWGVIDNGVKIAGTDADTLEVQY